MITSTRSRGERTHTSSICRRASAPASDSLTDLPGSCRSPGGRHGGRQEGGILSASEFHQPHAVGEAVRHPADHLHRRPCLADATRPGNRHQPGPGQQLGDLRDLRRAPRSWSARARSSACSPRTTG